MGDQSIAEASLARRSKGGGIRRSASRRLPRRRRIRRGGLARPGEGPRPAHRHAGAARRWRPDRPV